MQLSLSKNFSTAKINISISQHKTYRQTLYLHSALHCVTHIRLHIRETTAITFTRSAFQNSRIQLVQMVQK